MRAAVTWSLADFAAMASEAEAVATAAATSAEGSTEDPKVLWAAVRLIGNLRQELAKQVRADPVQPPAGGLSAPPPNAAAPTAALLPGTTAAVEDSRLAAVAVICEQLGYALLDTLSVLRATDADDSPTVRVAAGTLERAGWLVDRACLLAGGATPLVDGGADGWFLTPSARKLISQLQGGAA